MSSFPLADTDIISVAEAWTQANAADYVWTKLPRCKVRSERDGGSGTTTYKLNKIETFLLNSTGLADQPINKPAPAPENIEEVSVTLTSSPLGTPHPIARPLRSMRHRNAAFEQVVEGELSRIYQGLENLTTARLTSPTYFTAETWTAVLDTGNADPTLELNTKLLPARKYTSGNRWKLIGIIDQRVLMVMQALVEFHGGGTGSGVVSFADQSVVTDFLRARMGLDELHVIKGAYNNAVLGATPSIADLGAGLAWFGLVDTISGQDMISEPAYGPDGALCWAMGMDPFVHNFIPGDGREVEVFQGKVEAGINTPRTTGGPFSGKWGFYLPTAQNLS